jgi:hypothetical protein
MSAQFTADRAQAASLAQRAYHAGVREDWPAASAAMAEAGRQGPNVIALVLTTFCDTTLSLQREMRGMPPLENGVPEDGPVRPVWLNADTGKVTADADGLPPAVRWAGQLVAARAALDFDGFQALLLAMPADGLKRGEYATALLMSCATLANRARRAAARRDGPEAVA